MIQENEGGHAAPYNGKISFSDRSLGDEANGNTNNLHGTRNTVRDPNCRQSTEITHGRIDRRENGLETERLDT